MRLYSGGVRRRRRRKHDAYVRLRITDIGNEKSTQSLGSSLTRMKRSPDCDLEILNSPSTNVVSIHARDPAPVASISKSRATRPGGRRRRVNFEPGDAIVLGSDTSPRVRLSVEIGRAGVCELDERQGLEALLVLHLEREDVHRLKNCAFRSHETRLPLPQHVQRGGVLQRPPTVHERRLEG